MSDGFNCPKCDNRFDIGKLELWEVYDEDGKETELDCVCGAEFIVTSCVNSWSFGTELSE